MSNNPSPVYAIPDGFGWNGYYFQDGYLVNPRGDRYTRLAVEATQMARQTEAVRDLMYWRPSAYYTDVVMHHFIDRPQPKHQVKQDYIIQVSGLSSDDCRVESPL